LQYIKKVKMQGRYKIPIPILTSGCSSFRERGHGKRFQVEFKSSENGFEIKNEKFGHGSKKLEIKCSVAFGFKLKDHTFWHPLQAHHLPRRFDVLRKGVMR
jgi:hypothetical protein